VVEVQEAQQEQEKMVALVEAVVTMVALVALETHQLNLQVKATMVAHLLQHTMVAAAVAGLLLLEEQLQVLMSEAQVGRERHLQSQAPL
jgi:hypothetical protein